LLSSTSTSSEIGLLTDRVAPILLVPPSIAPIYPSSNNIPKEFLLSLDVKVSPPRHTPTNNDGLLWSLDSKPPLKNSFGILLFFAKSSVLIESSVPTIAPCYSSVAD